LFEAILVAHTDYFLVHVAERSDIIVNLVFVGNSLFIELDEQKEDSIGNEFGKTRDRKDPMSRNRSGKARSTAWSTLSLLAPVVRADSGLSGREGFIAYLEVKLSELILLPGFVEGNQLTILLVNVPINELPREILTIAVPKTHVEIIQFMGFVALR